MATAVALLMAVGLATIPYNYGSGRWVSEWVATTWGIGAMMFVVFMPWFVVSVGLGASGVLVPVTMILLTVAFGAGRWMHWRQVRARR